MKKADRIHLQKVADLGCVVCRNLGFGYSPAEIHHLRKGCGAGQRSAHKRSIPLCPSHHRNGGYVLETRSRRRPMPPIRDKAFSSCRWRRAVLTLDASQQAWIRYCYGFDLNFRYQREICRFVWENYLKQHEGVKFQKRVEKRLIQLVWLAVQDRAAKNRNELYKEYAGVALSRLLSVDRSGWIRIYSSHWKGLKRACKIMDDNALSLVYSKINSDTEETPMG